MTPFLTFPASERIGKIFRIRVTACHHATHCRLGDRGHSIPPTTLGMLGIMRAVSALAFFALCVCTALICAPLATANSAAGQVGQEARFSKADGCIAVTVRSNSSRLWKYGEPEHQDFARASATQEPKSRKQLFSDFLNHYSDSEYRDIALLLKINAEGDAADWDAVASDSRKLLRSSTLDDVALLVGAYSYLADALFHIRADDFSVYTKIVEVEWVVACGRNAVRQLRTRSSSKETESVASSAEFTFAVTQAQACLLGNDEAGAFRESDMALRMKPSDPRPNYLYALTMLRSQSPDYAVGIFYLARATSLGLGNDALKKTVEDVYKAYHGSGRGFDQVVQVASANSSPPLGFRIEPRHAKNHMGAKVAVGLALAGILGYAIAKDPQATVQTLAEMGGGGAETAGRSSAKVLLFGGEDHRTFLGCLNCPPGAEDSVYTPGGTHGSRGASESIWNKATFGSPASEYSACSPYASDPPVIVEADGTYLGRLTLNRYHGQIGIGTRYYAWLRDSVCN